MGKRQRNRQRAFNMRKLPNESKATFAKRVFDWLCQLDAEIPSPNFGDDK